MAIEVTVQVSGSVTACVVSDVVYSPDVIDDVLRRCRENALALYVELDDADAEAQVDES